jgi:hypothetical protein
VEEIRIVEATVAPNTLLRNTRSPPATFFGQACRLVYLDPTPQSPEDSDFGTLVTQGNKNA